MVEPQKPILRQRFLRRGANGGILLDPKLDSKVWQIKQRRSWIHSVNQALSSEGIPQAKTIDGI
jgi:hypothetical protein